DNNTGDLTIDLTQSANSALNDDGGYVIKGTIIVINDGGTFIALSSVCTHSGCTISYSAANGNLPCGCHGSIFSTTGSVLQGPASSALKRYTVTRDGDILTIS
ncbi:MAG: Rieske (2Fe-2S) protein, partial [Bacteroidales bacterium]|nr:Rieske (2Fe-2S) protein [Bacteroidales bacterium]